MFGLSFFELLAVLGLVLLVFGPEKLPEIAKTLGKLSGELKKNSDSVRKEFYNAVYPPADEMRASYRNLTTSPLNLPEDLNTTEQNCTETKAAKNETLTTEEDEQIHVNTSKPAIENTDSSQEVPEEKTPSPNLTEKN
jgi:TatA/E family protein of Tat protein translocase